VCSSDLVALDHQPRRPACYVPERGSFQRRRCAAQRDLYERVENPREGGQELSAKKGSETEGAGHSRHSKKSKSSDRTARKGDLGRALRSVYDDTLRETVPDDLVHLIGKLS